MGGPTSLSDRNQAKTHVFTDSCSESKVLTVMPNKPMPPGGIPKWKSRLKKGPQALDHPKLIGVVMNEASGSDQANYDGQFYDYGASKPHRVDQT
jgi:hypothetical protein